jgi:hypothetical protein
MLSLPVTNAGSQVWQQPSVLRVETEESTRDIGPSASDFDFAVVETFINKRMERYVPEVPRSLAELRAIVQRNEWLIGQARQRRNADNQCLKLQMESAIAASREVLEELGRRDAVESEKPFLRPARPGKVVRQREPLYRETVSLRAKVRKVYA